MKKNNIEKIDFSFLPKKLIKKTKSLLKEILFGLGKVKWPIEAVVIGGGYKNKEILFDKKEINSDIDMFVFSNFIPFFWNKLLKIQKEINSDKFLFHYRGVFPVFLKHSKTFWAYKLKKGGIVVRGNKNILEKIKATEKNIPQIEAIRILFQNLVVWLKKLKNKNNPKSEMILRSYLNLGESYLTFFKRLKPSYRERRKEFQLLSEELRIEKKLRKKIVLGYLTKIKPDLAREKALNYNFSYQKAKKQCWQVICNLCSKMFPDKESLEQYILSLEERENISFVFNLIFLYFLHKNKRIKPKTLPILFNFKVVDLWKIAFYHEFEEKIKRDNLLRKYFSFDSFSDKDLIKLYESHPRFSLVEIN